MDWHFYRVLQYFWERFLRRNLSGVQTEFLGVLKVLREYVRSGWIPTLQVESLLSVGETVYTAHFLS